MGVLRLRLFHAPAEVPGDRERAALRELEQLDPERTTPLEALQLLSRLVAQLRGAAK